MSYDLDMNERRDRIDGWILLIVFTVILFGLFIFTSIRDREGTDSIRQDEQEVESNE